MSCERDSALASKDTMMEERNSAIHQKEKLLSELQQVSAQSADYKKQLSKVRKQILSTSLITFQNHMRISVGESTNNFNSPSQHEDGHDSLMQQLCDEKDKLQNDCEKLQNTIKQLQSERLNLLQQIDQVNMNLIFGWLKTLNWQQVY